MGTPVFFGEVMAKAAEIVCNPSFPPAVGNPLLIRDVYGLVSIGLNIKRTQYPDAVSNLENEISKLGAYAASPGVICADDLFDADRVFGDPAIVQFVVPGTELSVRLLDRQITGQDWLSGVSEPGELTAQRSVPRLVFLASRAASVAPRLLRCWPTIWRKGGSKYC
jgi:hypothetical protein